MNTRSSGSKSRGATANRGVVSEPLLTEAQQELALDIVQLTLDIAGIFEPTPFADGTSALISIGRGNWLGAVISGVGILPYIGDIAKAGKVPQYIATLNKAIAVAHADVKFARYLRPALGKLKKLLDTIPTGRLSPRLKSMVNSLKKPIDSFLGVGKVAEDLNDLASFCLLYTSPSPRDS